VVLLSATTTVPFETDSQLLRRLDQFAEKQIDIAFYLGGQGAVTNLLNYKPKAIIVTNSIEGILK
jgi:MerR family transcriptional regulator, light-induced transcriptional regulator